MQFPVDDRSITPLNALVYTLREIDSESVYAISLNEVLNVVQLTPDPVTPRYFKLAADALKIITQSMAAVVLSPEEVNDDECEPLAAKRGTPAGGGGLEAAGKRGKK